MTALSRTGADPPSIPQQRLCADYRGRYYRDEVGASSISGVAGTPVERAKNSPAERALSSVGARLASRGGIASAGQWDSGRAPLRRVWIAGLHGARDRHERTSAALERYPQHSGPRPPTLGSAAGPRTNLKELAALAESCAGSSLGGRSGLSGDPRSRVSRRHKKRQGVNDTSYRPASDGTDPRPGDEPPS